MFTGRRFDFEIRRSGAGRAGLYYYRARYYNPYIGRFLQTDPVGYCAGMNLYAYCGNNPLGYVDPYGLDKYVLGYGGGSDDGGRIGFARWSDAGELIQMWYFYPDSVKGKDAFEVWIDWVQNDERLFNDSWQKEQAGYQLATYDREGEEYFDEYLFWNIQACVYMGACKSSEIALLDSEDIKFVEGKQNYFKPWEISWTAPHPETYGPSMLAHELGHALAYVNDKPDWEEEDCAFQRENAIRWWYYINMDKDLIPIDDYVKIDSPYTDTRSSWDEYIRKGGFSWAN